MTIIDINGKRPSSPATPHLAPSLDCFETTALAALSQKVIKVLAHLDGVHGVYRQSCEPDDVVIRAKQQHYMLLDLGHVVRLYFGDDYFDLYLDTHVPYQRDESLEARVVEMIAENQANERSLESRAEL